MVYRPRPVRPGNICLIFEMDKLSEILMFFFQKIDSQIAGFD